MKRLMRVIQTHIRAENRNRTSVRDESELKVHRNGVILNKLWENATETMQWHHSQKKNESFGSWKSKNPKIIWYQNSYFVISKLQNVYFSAIWYISEIILIPAIYCIKEDPNQTSL